MAMVRTVDSPRCCATSRTQAAAAVLGLKRVQNRRQVPFELHVDDGADHLRNATILICGCGH